MNNFNPIIFLLAIAISTSEVYADNNQDELRAFKLKNGKVTASQVSTTLDSNGDGFTANLTTGFGDSNHGRLYGRSVSEVKPSLSDPTDPTSFNFCAMPNGEPGVLFELEIFNGVLRIDGLKGAVILSKNDGTACFEASSCLDHVTGQLLDGCKFTGDWKLNITDGLGELKNATGQLTLKGDGTILFAHPTGNFADFDGLFEGDIYVPRKNQYKKIEKINQMS
ncbi:MAG: hypothetical protein L3J75_14275 [Methylococcaceae bacterium]|nr:hypothetical protein [Methylococcaceae bacterium]